MLSNIRRCAKKNQKLLMFIVLIIFILCAVKYIIMPIKPSNEDTTENVNEESTAASASGRLKDAKHVLKAEEIDDLTIDYSIKIPIQKILNREDGYERYYDEMIKFVEDTSKEIANFPFYQEEGYYISNVPVYHFNAEDNTVNSEVQIVLFSKDLQKQAVVCFFYGQENEILVSVMFSFGNFQVLEDAPELGHIFLNNTYEFVLDSENTLTPGSLYNITVEGDYFHALDYELLQVSYSKLTDPNYLEWVDFK